MYADRIKKGSKPFIPPADFEQKIADADIAADEKENLKQQFRQILTRQLSIGESTAHAYETINLHISKCYTCDQIALWVYDTLVHPPVRTGPAPNEDLSAPIRSTYEEARSILGLSPRGAAALLRLCIQNLCIHLGEKGKNLDDDIGSLVEKGLDPRVQQALDVVRVIGNNAVHPGQIRLEDDRQTATKLFGLVNLIAEKMISEPKHVEAMFADLPQGQKDHIEKRDKGKP